VKILGTLGGNNAFDTFYSVRTRYNASLMNDTLNRVKKNVSLLTRNMKSTFANPINTVTHKPLGNKIIYINSSDITPAPIRDTSSITTYYPNNTDSLIVIG